MPCSRDNTERPICCPKRFKLFYFNVNMKSFHSIIRSSLLFSAILCITFGVAAQENRDISIRILNKRGRPVNNIMVNSMKTGNAGITDRTGLFIFKSMADDDTIAMRLSKYGDAFIPVTGMDSLVVTIRSSQNYSYNNVDGKSVIIGKNRLEMSTILDVPEMLKKKSYTSFKALLQGYYSPRGISSVNSGTEPLVVLDGMALGTVAEASPMINIYDIKTIEIQKDGFQWGVRGANGVIVVKTR